MDISNSELLNRNLFEFFLVKRNEGKSGKDREHLTVLCATSGDTGSAAIYGLRGKKDVSVFVMFPTGKVRPCSHCSSNLEGWQKITTLMFCLIQ